MAVRLYVDNLLSLCFFLLVVCRFQDGFHLGHAGVPAVSDTDERQLRHEGDIEAGNDELKAESDADARTAGNQQGGIANGNGNGFVDGVSSAEFSSVSDPSWIILDGLDNMNDMFPCCSYNTPLDTLKSECLANKWCAGFSTYYGTLKWSVANYASQPNTQLYIRQPPPPPLPPQPPVELWPRPLNWTSGASSVMIDLNTFQFQSIGVQLPLLDTVLKRFTAILRLDSQQGQDKDKDKDWTYKAQRIQQSDAEAVPALVGCDVSVSSSNSTLALGVDESYSLMVPAVDGGRAKLSAVTVFGAMRGLETFVSLWVSSTARVFTSAPLFVNDEPRFPYRGLMVDTARHYLPLDVLLTHLDAMSAAKLNVLHWHLIDTQSWPLVLQSLPNASAQAAYDPVAAIYTADDVHQLVQAAYERGIRVVPELDMPAVHFSSLLKGYPQFGAGQTSAGSESANLDPSNGAVWSALNSLVRELAALFPDDQIHVGFDEVDLDDWNTTGILQWMETQNYTALRQVESYFLNRIEQLAAAQDRHLIIWNDPVEEGVNVPSDVQLQVWNEGMDLVQQLSSQGYGVVYSSPFYLDNLSNSWDVLYEIDLGSDPVPSGLLGIEACMWGEKVDETNALSRVWPRAASVAEIAWSPDTDAYPKIAVLANDRIEAWRCRIRQRGIPAEPIQPSWCPFAPH